MEGKVTCQPNNIYQSFPCLKSVSNVPPINCDEPILKGEYPQEIQLPQASTFTHIEEEINEYFESYPNQVGDSSSTNDCDRIVIVSPEVSSESPEQVSSAEGNKDSDNLSTQKTACNASSDQHSLNTSSSNSYEEPLQSWTTEHTIASNEIDEYLLRCGVSSKITILSPGVSNKNSDDDSTVNMKPEASIENEDLKVRISQDEASDHDTAQPAAGDAHSVKNIAAEDTCTVSNSISPQHTDHEQVSVNSPALKRANESQGSLVAKYKHTLYHYMHSETDVPCPFIHKKKCTEDYDEEFASHLKSLLEHKQIKSEIDYTYYIHDHLKHDCKCSPSCSRLWKYCFAIKEFSALKYAEEGLVIFSSLMEKKVGKVTKQYKILEKVIGHGGFGKVYMLYGKLVVKEEHKHPLIFSNPTVFQEVTRLDCKHVVPLLEYIVGKEIEGGQFQQVFLSVMPYMNRRGLNEQFKKHSCVLNYMVEYKDKEQCIFNNYIVMYLHVFEGLRYLHSKKIVHGDVKDKNILVHQTCSCESPLLCSCPFGGRVTYVLGDMGLFWIEGEKLSGRYVEWAKAKQREPAGTAGMKAPELYFTGMHGEKCGSSKTDVWAGSVTMMKALVGFGKINESTEEITKYLNALSRHSKKYVDNIGKAYEIARKLKIEVEKSDCKDSLNETGFIHRINEMTQLLESYQQLKHYHWMSSHTYPEKLPQPFLLSIAHEASNIHQQCLDKMPSIHSTPMWKVMKNVAWIVTNGLRFLPQDRLTASQITEHLKIYS